MMTLLDEALAWEHDGYSVVPVAIDGTKRPGLKTWTQYTKRRPTADEVRRNFTAPTDGLGLICGAVSGNLEMYELEGRAVAEGLLSDLARLCDDNGLSELWQTLNAGYIEHTPGGGLHWYYRVDGPAMPNTKLARRLATDAELTENPTERIKVFIETRGEGGFSVIAPSAGRSHPNGKGWSALKGTRATIPTLAVEERDALYAIANMLDQLPDPETPVRPAGTTRQPEDGLRPGDDYNQRASWDDILTGWTRGRHFGGNCYAWTRPGKNPRDGISATTGRNDGDNLYVFSSSTEFEPERAYSKFAATTLLRFRGDYAAAARQLRADGYGDQTSLAPAGPPLTLDDAPAPRHLIAVDGTSARVIEPLTAERIVAHYGPTEDGTARALADLHADNLRYCPQRGLWLTWDGARWRWDEAESYREHIRDLARALPDDTGWLVFKKRALSAAGVTGIARFAQTDHRLTVHIDQLDARPYELNTPGGIINLRTGALQPADPAALHTRCTAVTPDYRRRSDLFTSFLTSTFNNDQALVGYVQRLLGISAIGTVLEQVLPFAHGSGANGKSTLLEAVMHALGRGDTGYAIAAPSEMLMVRKHTEHPAEIAQLAGARLVVCSELDDGQRFAEARIKQLTGRDSINARFMRRDPFTFTPSHTLWLLGNHKPNATTGGPAFWRRVQLVPFDHVVPAELQDRALGERLAEQAPAILAWLAQGAADYLRNGLGTPEAVTNATADYAHDQDTVGRFIEESCHLAVGSDVVQIAMAKIRAAYEQWCRDSGEIPVSAKRFGQLLRERFGVGESRSKSTKFYTGIALIEDEESVTFDERFR